MTIKMFVDECNSVIEKSNIKPNIEASCIRYAGVRILSQYFINKNIEIKSSTCADTDIYLTKKKNIKLQSGETVELDIEISFKTATKRTGNIIPVSKLQSKYELIASDKFIKFNQVIVRYELPTYELDKNNKNIKDQNFFGKIIKFKARDLVYLIYLLEKKYDIVFSEDDIDNVSMYTINGLSEIVSKHLN